MARNKASCSRTSAAMPPIAPTRTQRTRPASRARASSVVQHSAATANTDVACEKPGAIVM
jgi:hypothetical protein